MSAKRITVWGLFIVGVIIIVAGFVMTPDFLKSNLSADEISKLTPDNIQIIRIFQATSIVIGIVLVLSSLALYRFGQTIRHIIANILQLDQALSSNVSSRTAAFELFLISFLGLFFETLIIRWLSTEVRLFAYYKNLTLIAAFMGLGLGFMLAKKKLYLLGTFPLAFSALSAFILIGAANKFFLNLSNPAGSDVYIWGILQRSAILSFLSFFALIPFFFLATILVFIPLGQATGQAMHPFPPIRAYTINVLGSLAGVWGFSAISFLALPPLAWFSIGLILCLWLLRRAPRALVVNGAAVAIFLLLAFVLRGNSYWSPYYRIDLDPLRAKDAQGQSTQWGYALAVNYDYHQLILDLSPGFVQQHADIFPQAMGEATGYALPFQITQPQKVLVVGAGAGNDVATALRYGANRIDAVDIDPVILQIGKNLHPEKPYDSPRVNLITDDARSFFKKTRDRYDLIVYGMLDSHTLFSSMSSLRLDNFVYTVEGIREAKQILSNKGVMAIFFLSGKDWITQRLFNTLTEAFGAEPTLLQTGHSPLFLIGPGFDPVSLKALPTETRYQIVQISSDRQVEATTDDWPFLYLRTREIPVAYWQVIVLLALVSAMVIKVVVPGRLNIGWHFFLLGSAFLLLEVKSITDLALLFGSTWIVNSVVISAILVMVLAANLYVQRFKLLDMRIYYILLIMSLVLGYFLPLGVMLGQNVWLRAIAGSLVISLPLLFAGIIFSTSLKKTDNIEVAFGSNLLGSVIGGLLEYSSLVFGLRNLMLLALLLYVGSYIAGRSQQK